MNLLRNPGFEDGLQPAELPDGSKPRHLAYVSEVQVTGGAITQRYTVERGEINNPLDWFTWYAHQRTEAPVPWDPPNRVGWAEPETRLSETVHQRHRSGERAAYLFTYGRIHEAGMLQQVQVAPGDRLRFTAFGHAWSAHDQPTPKPPNCSNAGCGPLAWKAGTPGLNDDQRAHTLWVGIDPTGGVDPYAPTVIWGEGWHIYNAYRESPLMVEAIAEAATVTVFLKSSCLWRFTHNDVAWDDCELHVVENVPPPSPAMGRGAPRLQYARRMHVLPPTMTLERAQEIFALAWASGRETVGSSYDDAGIGDLDLRTAVLWDIPLADQGVLLTWYAEHYPGVRVEFAGAGEDEPLWLTYPTTYVPPRITSPYGPRGMGFHYGVDLRSSWAVWGTEVLAALDGEVVLTGIEPGKEYFGEQVQIRTLHQGQEVLLRYAHLVPQSQGGIYVRVGQRVMRGQKLGRPDNTGQSTADHLHFDVRVNGKYVDPALLIRWPEAPEPPSIPPPLLSSRQLVSLHCQSFGAAEKEFFRLAQPAVGKVFDLGAAAEIKSVSPETLVVYRHHIPDRAIAEIVQNPTWGMNWFFDQMPQDIVEAVRAGIVNYVETPLNEANQWFPTQVWAAAEMVFIEQLRLRIPGARPLTMTVSVGNPAESDYPALIPLAQATAAAGGAGGYHGYKPIASGVRFDDHAKWHECRHEGMDRVFRDAGVQLDWILTEVGACGGTMHGVPGNQWFEYDSQGGWRNAKAFGGDWPAYREMLRWYEARLRTGSARVLGATIFTTCTWDWWGFHLDENQLRELVW